MTTIIDIGLTRHDNYIDIDFASDGDFLLTEGLDTALDMSVLEQRRANESEMPSPQLRRGWWGNLLNDPEFEIGSKLWLLSQSRRTQSVLNSAEDYIRKSLTWMIEDNIIDNILVSAEYSGNSMLLYIQLVKNNDIILTALYDAFTNTGLVS